MYCASLSISRLFFIDELITRMEASCVVLVCSRPHCKEPSVSFIVDAVEIPTTHEASILSIKSQMKQNS